MVLSPATEWPTIETETGDAPFLFTNYVAALAAIPPICRFLRRLLFGWRGPRLGFHHHHGFGIVSSLFGAVVHWLLAFVFVYALAVIIEGLALTFSGEKNPPNALKLAVYSMTPVWLSGVFALMPGLGFMRLIAELYGVYVFWLGLPILMKAPAEKLGPYALTVVVCGIVLSFVLAGALGPFP